MLLLQIDEIMGNPKSRVKLIYNREVFHLSDFVGNNFTRVMVLSLVSHAHLLRINNLNVNIVPNNVKLTKERNEQT